MAVEDDFPTLVRKQLEQLDEAPLQLCLYAWQLEQSQLHQQRLEEFCAKQEATDKRLAAALERIAAVLEKRR
jgi:hypothetical protein